MLKPFSVLLLCAWAFLTTASAQSCHDLMEAAENHILDNKPPFASIARHTDFSCESWAFYKVWMEADGTSPKMTRHVVRHVDHRRTMQADPPQISQHDTRTCKSIIPAADALRQADLPKPYQPPLNARKGPLTLTLHDPTFQVAFTDLVLANGVRPHRASVSYSVGSSDAPFLEDWWRTHAPRLRACIPDNAP